MELLRIAGATLNQTPLDWDGNRDRIIRLLREARQQSVDVVCFPELCITGYNCEDMFLSLPTARMAERIIPQLLPETEGLIAVVGLPIFQQGYMYNAVAVLQNGKILGVNPKKILPKEGIHYESRWFQPASFQSSENIRLAGHDVPFGDLSYRFGSFGMAIEICEEGWRSQMASRAHSMFHGIELVLNPSASHFALGKAKTRETMVANNSRAMQSHYLWTNLLGLEAGRAVYDGGVIIAECGQVTTRGERFGFHDGALTMRDVDLDLARTFKLQNRAERLPEDKENERAHTIVGEDQLQFSSRQKPPLAAPKTIHRQKTDMAAVLNENEEFLAAQMLGLFDYLRKSSSRGYLVSLSGGCDSSCVAVLVAQGIRCAIDELGEEAFAERVGFARWPGQTRPQTARDWINRLLSLLYQATDNSTTTTFEAARALALELGAEFCNVNVQDMVNGYTQRANDALGRTLNWQTDDIALQNIQARARAPMAWLLANAKGAVLLATSNRSEVAVGYATMDGDTAGGLAPLGGIDKPFLRSFLRWMEKDCSWGLGPLPSLALVNCQAPTAELRPSIHTQTDEADLMPYEILGRIEKLLVRDRMAPQDILRTLTNEFTSHTREELVAFVSRFLRLFAMNQWKRERYAPAFHIDDESLDPKTWWRFPILSGCFSSEIRGLKNQEKN